MKPSAMCMNRTPTLPTACGSLPPEGALRLVAEEHLVELQLALQRMVASPETLAQLNRADLLEQARRGEVIVTS